MVVNYIFSVTFHYVCGMYHDNARALRSAIFNIIDSEVRPSETMEVSVGFNLLTIINLVRLHF